MRNVVTKQNYKEYRYLSDYRAGALEQLSYPELLAQKYHIKEIYRGIKGPMKTIEKIALQSIDQEIFNRRYRKTAAAQKEVE